MEYYIYSLRLCHVLQHSRYSAFGELASSAIEMEGLLSLCYIALATLVSLWFLPKLKLLGGKSKKLPPGPWTLPIIGSLHHVATALPHRRMMELSRRHGPLMHLKLGEVSTIIVSSAEAASLVMKTNDVVFASRPCSPTQDIVGCSGTGLIFGTYGDRWRQMRKVCIIELLSGMQVRRMESIRAKEVDSLLRSIAAAGPTVNLSAKMSALSNDVVARAVFGGKFTQQEEYLEEVDTVNRLVSGSCLADLFPSSRLVRWLSNGERRLRTSYGNIQRIIADIIEERRAARAAHGRTLCTDDEDLLDVLLRLQEHNSLAFPLTREIIAIVISVSTFVSSP